MACHTLALCSARNAAAFHKANRTMEFLYLDGNAIGSDGAVALADAIKALLMMLCFLWNMTGVLVTWMNTASLPTCSLTRKEAHLRHNLEHVVCHETSATAWQRETRPGWNIRSDEVHVVRRGIVFAMLITCKP